MLHKSDTFRGGFENIVGHECVEVLPVCLERHVHVQTLQESDVAKRSGDEIP